MSFDTHVLAWVTIQAFCMVIVPAHSEDAFRARVVDTHASFSRSLSRTNDVHQVNESLSWTCEDEKSASVMSTSFASLDISRLDEIVEDAMSKFGNIDAKDLFIDNPAVGDYFDNISAAAGLLENALKTARRVEGFRMNELERTLLSKYLQITKAIDKMFKESSLKMEEQTAPLGLQECRLLPEQLRNYTIVPIFALNAFTGRDALAGTDRKAYNYDQCTASNVEESLRTLVALLGENCDKGVGRNGSVEQAIQEDMMQYARENQNHFEGVDDGNRCLHVFIARYTKSEEAVEKFKLSLDKYYLAIVTIQAFCSVFVPTCSKEAHRTKMLATHSSLAKGLARVNSSQFHANGTWTCDTTPEELVANMSGSCEDLWWTVEAITHLLGEHSADEYVDKVFEMVDAVRSVDKATFARLQEARTQREVEVRKKTRLGVLDKMANLLKFLQLTDGDVAKPFGPGVVMLLPEAVDFEAPSLSRLFEDISWTVGFVRKLVDAGKTDGIDGGLQSSCEREKFEPGNTLGRIVEPMREGCETQVEQSSDGEDATLATKMMTYAMSHGFDGCEDNKCLQIFIARYTKYRSYDEDKLKKSVDKYALLSVILQGFCASTNDDHVRKEDTRLKMVKMILSLKDAVDLLNNLSSKADIYRPCAASYPAWTSTLHEIATSVVKNATSSHNTTSWEDRQGLHKLVAKGIVAKLDASTYSDGYFFKALAYLPFMDDSQHGFLSLPVCAEDVIRNESKLVKYVVSRHRRRAAQTLALVPEKWDAIKKKGNEILAATFSTSASNLSKRIEEIESRFENDIHGAFLSLDGFRALVVLRCGYEFAWYELGYRYFPAGFTTDDYVLATEQRNKYKFNCGQIVFFP